MKKIIIGLVVIIAVIGIIAATRNKQGPANDVSSNQSDTVPQLALKDLSGKAVALADFKGKTLVVNAWAAWCPFCRQELPDFAAVQKELGDKVVIIAVDRAESVDTQKRYTDELGVTNDLIFLQDPGDSFYQAIGGFSMPETIFVDKDGNIRDHKRGPMDAAEIRQRIEKIL